MMAEIAPPEEQPDLEEVDIHDILSNERRQRTLEMLEKANAEMTVRDLSERIAALESGENPPPRNIRQSAYVSLLQTHLPKLDDLNIVHYDNGRKTVKLSSTANQVSTFMGDESGSATSMDPYYLLLSIIGLAMVAISWAGGPAFTGIPTAVVFLLIAILASVRSTRADWPFIDILTRP